MVRHLSLVGLAVATLMGTAVPAVAQAPATGRLYRGLFGSGLQGTNQVLTFDGSLGGGFDTNVLSAEPTVAGDPLTESRSSGSFGTGAVALGYNLKLSRVNLRARGGGVMSHYTNRLQPWIKTYRGDVGGSAPLWAGANLSMNYNVTFRPFYYLPWVAAVGGIEEIAGPSPEIDETAGAIVEYHTNTSGSASLTQSVTRRATLALSYGYQQSDSQSGARNLRGQNGYAGMNYSITRGLGLRLGYGFSEAGYANQQNFRGRNINAGLTFNRALSLTRSTTLSFTTGSSATLDQNRTYYRLDAHVNVRHELGRTWTAQFLYNRAVSFDDAFRVPVPLDSFTLGVRGMFSRQLDFFSSIGTVAGALGFGSAANGFDTYYARTGVLWGLSRIVGLGLDYTYFQYRFDGQNALPVGLVRRADRQHVRAFVTVRAALFKGQNRGSR
jgi:hypothetical protein